MGGAEVRPLVNEAELLGLVVSTEGDAARYAGPGPERGRREPVVPRPGVRVLALNDHHIRHRDSRSQDTSESHRAKDPFGS